MILTENPGYYLARKLNRPQEEPIYYSKETDFGPVGPFDAIIVLGAAVLEDENGKLTLPTIVPGQTGLIVGGYLRAIATAALYENGECNHFALTGGAQQSKEGVTIRRDELLLGKIADLGVPKDHMETIGGVGHGNTQWNVEDMKVFLKQHPYYRRIGILTNKWHHPRTREFIKKDPFFQQNDNLELEYLVAEDVVCRLIPDGHQIVMNYQNEMEDWLLERLIAEYRGIGNFLKGTYSAHQDSLVTA